MNIDLKNKKTLLIGGGILVAVILLYMTFSDNSDSSANLTVEVYGESNPIEEILGRDVLNLVSQMRGINLDTSILSDPAFKSLSDFTVEIPLQPIGRRDPFAPL